MVPTLQRRNASRDALRHKSAQRRSLKTGRRDVPERHYHAERSNDDRAQCINRRSAALRDSTGIPPSLSTA
ncbi:DUF1534 domain-containing protein [Pseudomonas syringae pv. actinidiae]|nr:DUF1534 domain-containing protein [Pseudomonas syringae pv. actinidiae]